MLARGCANLAAGRWLVVKVFGGLPSRAEASYGATCSSRQRHARRQGVAGISTKRSKKKSYVVAFAELPNNQGEKGGSARVCECVSV